MCAGSSNGGLLSDNVDEKQLACRVDKSCAQEYMVSSPIVSETGSYDELDDPVPLALCVKQQGTNMMYYFHA